MGRAPWYKKKTFIAVSHSCVSSNSDECTIGFLLKSLFIDLIAMSCVSFMRRDIMYTQNMMDAVRFRDLFRVYKTVRM